MAVDGAGFAFAVFNTYDSNSLCILGPQGQVIHTIKLDSPWSVAIAPDGCVWVAVHDGGGMLCKF